MNPKAPGLYPRQSPIGHASHLSHSKLFRSPFTHPGRTPWKPKVGPEEAAKVRKELGHLSK
jgi:hypothetical protein